MGCGNSTPAHGVDANLESDVIIIKDDNANEHTTEPAKIEAAETADNSLQNESHNGGFAIKALRRPTMEKRGESRPRKSDVGREIENAWGASKATKNAETVKPQEQILNDLNFESEYGRDGVDLTSTHVTGDYETDKLVSDSLGPRTSPDGTHNVANYSDGINRTRVLHKVNTTPTR